ncbi:MAG: baseplate J/gp47 family protein [Geobacteraceae bacterium]|nr:baseplate J/gp47 family protein [Geobacteraceae bacterium]
MITPFDKSFDDLLANLLTDYQNQSVLNDQTIDTSKGSLAFIKSACMASALWGIYQAQGYIGDQIFPDTADEANLERHGFVRGLPRKPGESVGDFLARLLDYIRRPPAGGNQQDYVKWALSIVGVKSAYCFPLANGLGTVDVVIAADPVITGSIIPDAALLAQVKAYIDTVRPVTAWSVRVLAPEVLTINVTITTVGLAADQTQTLADLTSYLAAMVPGQPLYLAQLVNVAIINGADNAIVSAPAATITPANYQIIRPGVINVL